MKTIHVLGGGTFSHVRAHLSLAAPAFGGTAKELVELLNSTSGGRSAQAVLELTRMADPRSDMITNTDVSNRVDQLIADPDCRAVVFTVAMTDFEGTIAQIESGKYAERLQSRAGMQHMILSPADKVIGRIRKARKDIFVVGFKTTAGAKPDEQYLAGLKLLKENSLNLVVANDIVTRHNMIIAPEETRYCPTNSRKTVLQYLAMMIHSRLKNKFTKSVVIPGKKIEWDSKEVPETLRTVVNHCIEAGAYKPFLGKTAGHFAARLDDRHIVTTIRKTNLNNLKEVGMVKLTQNGPDAVLAHGFKPSVGGQSQRIIFSEHPDVDCIVHFHCPPKVEMVAVPQWPNECGSHECGKNTSRHLEVVDLGDGHQLKAVYLDSHGPNIVFNREVPAKKIIDYIDRTFDLGVKTGGTVAAMAA